MAKYKYRAMNSAGKKIEGSYEAKSKDEVIAIITSNGYYPLMVEKVVERTEIKVDIFEKITTKDMSVFCRQLYTMMDAGVSINRALNIMSKQIENKRLRETLVNVEDDVKKGKTLSEAMSKHKDIFPNLLLSMIQSGEVSGNLDTMLLRMSLHFEKETKINNKVKNAMTYPTVLSIVAVLAVAFILTFVMPTFIEIFEGEGIELPLATRILLGTSGFIKQYGWSILLVIILLISLFTIYKKTENGILTLDKIKLKIPIIGELNKKIIVSRFTRTLSTLSASGVSIVQSLSVVSGVVGNKIAEEALLKVRERVIRGDGLSDPIRKAELFPEMLVSMIAIGEETGSLDDILNKTADFYDEEVESAIQRATTLIEPLLIVVIGIVIGFMVISIMVPMFDMYTQM